MNYYSMNQYCLEHYGKKLYKLSLDGGFTCPNRDGTLGINGCIFCSKGGSGDFAESGGDLNERIERAKQRVAAKNKSGGWIAYFQSFTNTYAPLSRLRELYLPLAQRNDIDVISIATRPDCLPQNTVDFLGELNRLKPVWVELGLQTVKKESVSYIRRGYENMVYADAVRRLKRQGIYVITHIILGLPGESVTDMKNTLAYVIKAGSDGVKLQLLHILDDADIYKDYRNGSVTALTQEEYLDILKVLLPMLPPKMAVHRLTGDGDKKHLVAPLWSADKKRVLNAIRQL